MPLPSSFHKQFRKTFSVIKKTFSVIKPYSTETVSKKICGPLARNFFLAKFLGLHLCRRVRAQILAKICTAVCWPKSAPPCDCRNLRAMYSETGFMHPNACIEISLNMDNNLPTRGSKMQEGGDNTGCETNFPK